MKTPWLIPLLAFATFLVLPSSAGAPAAVIDVINFAFEDDDGDGITSVPVGATVQWRFVQGTHSSTEGTDTPLDAVLGSEWDSGVLAAGSPPPTFEHTFTDAGAFAYYCSVHPAMRGVIVVA